MSNPHQIVHVLRMWLVGDSGLEKSIRKTAEEALFPERDIRFAVDHLRDSVTPEKLEQWKERAARSLEYTKPDASTKNILCLHAGNLPLVGFQDVIAVMLSGNRYFGKISRKDPWLITSFLDICQKEMPDVIGGYSTEIASFSSLNADAVLFSGSEKSVKPVRSELERLGAVHPGTRYLIRTAQLSLAYIETKSSLPDLTEAVTRYSGRGCRSVGVVVSPMGLDEVFTEYSDVMSIPENGLRYSIAYATAVGLPVFQLADQFIIQTSDISMIRPGVVLWVKGGKETLDEIRAGLGRRLQTVYSDTKRLVDGSKTFEPLDKAQKPDIDWMPDGVDALKWLWRESDLSSL